MLPELVDLPRWLLVGLGLGLVGSLVVATLFLVAGRLFPTPASAGAGHHAGQDRRRTEIRTYLRRIDEQFAEDHPVDGHSVAFFLPERDVAITFDAQAYYRLARSDVTPVLVEHEMPGVQLGARLPFETPDVSYGTNQRESERSDRGWSGHRRETRDHPRSAFRELGLSTSATPDEVREAYRERVKEVHPDHGGDPDAFRRVRDAYATAKRYADD